MTGQHKRWRAPLQGGQRLAAPAPPLYPGLDAREGWVMATVLVIDDHAASRDYLTFVLEHTGHRVITAEDGSRGLELARSDRPALIISDILMPTMDGIEFARHL